MGTQEDELFVEAFLKKGKEIEAKATRIDEERRNKVVHKKERSDQKDKVSKVKGKEAFVADESSKEHKTTSSS